jgi:hypothetical protein
MPKISGKTDAQGTGACIGSPEQDSDRSTLDSKPFGFKEETNTIAEAAQIICPHADS